MKKLLYLFLVSFCLSLFAQNPGGQIQEKTFLDFSYDDSGNQIKKELKTEFFYPNPWPGGNEPTLNINDCFSVYPSPTSGPLTLDWSYSGSCGLDWKSIHGNIASISLSDFKGDSELITFNSTQTKVNIDLTSNLEGIYIIRFLLSDGYIITKKIQKYNP